MTCLRDAAGAEARILAPVLRDLAVFGIATLIEGDDYRIA